MKAGTTSLYHDLCKHPQVMRALYKEVHFFDRNYSRGLNWYRAHFPQEHRKRRADCVTGESSPGYLAFPWVPPRVRSAVPHCRFITVLRNPIDRAYSDYHHQVRLGAADLSFEEAIQQERRRLEADEQQILASGSETVSEYLRASYLRRGVYHLQLRCWFSLFPREQLLILEYGEAFQDIRRTMERICLHLRIRPWAPRRAERRNVGAYRDMNPATRASLRRLFEPHNQELFRLLGQSFDWD